MNLISALKHFKRDSFHTYCEILKRIAPIVPDRLYIRWMYYFTFHKRLNLRNPKEFSEKIQWLKLYDREDFYTSYVDKLESKKHVASLIGDKYIIPTLGVWQNFEDIDFNRLPDKFVLKTTHDGGSAAVIVCANKKSFDKGKAKIIMNKSLKHSIYSTLKEWPYKNVKRQIMAEEFIESDDGRELKDYKFFCFNGQAKLCQVISDRGSNEAINFYDREWQLQPFCGLNIPNTASYEIASYEIAKPALYTEMLRIADTLSKDIPFLRVDLYYTNNQIYFGELTFYPASGLGYFEPNEWNEKIGSWIEIKTE